MDDDMLRVLEDIIKVERQMKERFKKLAQKAETPEMRGLFQQLAHEEEGHERMLYDRLIALRLLRDG